MKTKSIFAFIALFNTILTYAQNITISPSGITPEQKINFPKVPYDSLVKITNAAEGDIFYDQTFKTYRFFDGELWNAMAMQRGANELSAIAWKGNLPSTNAYFDYSLIALDKEKNVIVGGKGVVHKYDREGNSIWKNPIQAYEDPYNFYYTTSLTIDNNNNIYTTESRYHWGQNTGDWFVYEINKYERSNGQKSILYNSGTTYSYSANSLTFSKIVSGNNCFYLKGNLKGINTYKGVTLNSINGNTVLYKLDDQNNLLWYKQLNNSVDDIKIKSDGSLIVSGTFSSNISLGTFQANSNGGTDVFLASFSPTGSVNWLKSFGNSNNESSKKLTFDTFGNIYLVGSFDGYTSFNGVYQTSYGSSDVFVVKYLPNGTPDWFLKGGGIEYDYPNDIVSNIQNYIYLHLNFSGSTKMGSYDYTSSTTLSEKHLLKIDINGNIIWGRKITTNSSGGNCISCLMIDNEKSLFLSGQYQNSIIFGKTTLTSPNKTDVFVVRFGDDL